MIRRRTYDNGGGIVLPEKLFCLDFQDKTNNTDLKVVDTVSGVQMTKENPGTVEFLEDYQGFGRVIRCNTRSSNNMYQVGWNTLPAYLMENFPNKRPFSIAFFSNNKGTSSIRSGLMDTGIERVIGWQEGVTYYPGIINTGGVAYTAVYRVSYSAYNPGDIGLFVMCWDTLEGVKKITRNEVSFSTLSVSSFSGKLNEISAGILTFLRSQEGYYFAAGGICAGIAIYAGMLTDDQVKYIFDTKTL